MVIGIHPHIFEVVVFAPARIHFCVSAARPACTGCFVRRRSHKLIHAGVGEQQVWRIGHEVTEHDGVLAASRNRESPAGSAVREGLAHHLTGTRFMVWRISCLMAFVGGIDVELDARLHHPEYDLEEHRFFIVRKFDALNRQWIAAKGTLTLVAHHLGGVLGGIHLGAVVLCPLIIPLINGPVLVIHRSGGIERIGEGDADAGLFHVQRSGHVDGFTSVAHAVKGAVPRPVGLPDP